MNRLSELRNEKKLSQRDMAKAFNVSQSTYNNWENANTQPSIEQLISLADFFEVSVDYLIGNSDDFGLINKNDRLSFEQQKLLKLYEQSNEQTRNAVLVILENTANHVK